MVYDSTKIEFLTWFHNNCVFFASAFLSRGPVKINKYVSVHFLKLWSRDIIRSIIMIMVIMVLTTAIKLIVFERGTLKSIQWNRGTEKVYCSVLQTVSAIP